MNHDWKRLNKSEVYVSLCDFKLYMILIPFYSSIRMSVMCALDHFNYDFSNEVHVQTVISAFASSIKRSLVQTCNAFIKLDLIRLSLTLSLRAYALWDWEWERVASVRLSPLFVISFSGFDTPIIEIYSNYGKTIFKYSAVTICCVRHFFFLPLLSLSQHLVSIC